MPKDDNYFAFLDKCVHCIAVLLDSEVGLKEMITIPYALRKLALQLDNKNYNTNHSSRRGKMIVEMMTAVAVLPELYR